MKPIKDNEFDEDNEVNKIKLSKKEKLTVYITTIVLILFFFIYKYF